MDYPAFAEPQYSVLPTEPKLSIDELETIYDEFSGLGLYLAPKLAGKKFPHWGFWKKSDNTATKYDKTIAMSYQTKPEVSGWCVITGDRSERVVVVDIDPKDVIKNGSEPIAVYNQIQAMGLTRFVLRTPSNGLHLYYRVPRDMVMLDNSAPPIKGVDIRGEGGQVVFVGGFNRYVGNKALTKGVPEGHTATYTKLPDGEYHNIPEMTDKLYAWITSNQVQTHKARAKERVIEADNYQHTDIGRARLLEHQRQSLDDRKRVVGSALDVVLRTWDYERTYDEWIQLWMATHHGSDGDEALLETILLSEHVAWSDGEQGKLDFADKWRKHTHRDDTGFTVASLFWLARKAGWLNVTGYELNEFTDTFCTKYVSEWLEGLEDVPKRLLLQSQTGSGKTYAIKLLWQRLGRPKTVIFVPTKKLAIELAQTLLNEHGLPVTLYRDIETSDVIEHGEMQDAQVLVTTLQTFATKLHAKMEDYGLVYVEESDQLLAQFAKGGNAYDGSHVDAKQALAGYDVILSALEKSGVMWFVDATMSKITLEVAKHTKHPLAVVQNTFTTNKAPVTLVSEIGNAYQAIWDGLVTKKQVVVAVDTASEANAVYQVMGLSGALKGKKTIVINRFTEQKANVKAFMADINVEAAKYDLVIYNSVMASGVSITSIEPDIIVQICSYLSPRVNLQILNRYRKQKEVVLFYRASDNLYTKTATQIEDEVYQRASRESHLINLPLVVRGENAKLRLKVSAMSMADNAMQRRASRDFYISLLEADGRDVHHTDGTPVRKRVVAGVDRMKELRKEKKVFIAANWHTVPIIDNDNPARPEADMLEIALGEAHAHIHRSLRGNIPTDVDPTYVYDVVAGLAKYGFILTAFLRQELALRRAEEYLGDDGTSLANIRNNITIIRMVAKITDLYPTLDTELTPDMLEAKAQDFIATVVLMQDDYDTLMPTRESFAVVRAKYEDTKLATMLAKYLLKLIGLKQRTHKVRLGSKTVYNYRIENLPQVRDFLSWRNASDGAFADLNLSDNPIADLIADRQAAYTTYTKLELDLQRRVVDLVDEHNDFVAAVDVVTALKGKVAW